MDNHSDFDSQRPAVPQQRVVLRRVLEGRQNVRRRFSEIRQYFYGSHAHALLEHLLA